VPAATIVEIARAIGAAGGALATTSGATPPPATSAAAGGARARAAVVLMGPCPRRAARTERLEQGDPRAAMMPPPARSGASC